MLVPMVSSLDVRPRPAFVFLLLGVLFWPIALRAAEAEVEPPLFSYVGTALAAVGDVSIGEAPVEIPLSVTPAGPLFALAPLVERLGGSLRLAPGGEGYVLAVADKEFLLGPGSKSMVCEQEIIPLSQRPWMGDGGLQVPLDLLERTYGEEMGNGFVWDGVQRLLSVDRRRAQQLQVIVDTVHLRGTTTLVLEFPARPRYRVIEDFAGVEVRMLGDRIDTRVQPPPIHDPLVRAVRISAERIRLELDPQAQATHYVLNRPYRLVFDIHRGAPQDDTPQLVLPSDRPGVHTIVIDPGHGGSESGAVSAEGTQEKDLTLALARSLKRRLEGRLPVRVILTRNQDSELSLEERTAVTNQNKADLFISLHLNSSMGNSAYGAETYFLSIEASDEGAAAAAEAENRSSGADLVTRADGDPLYDLQLMLWDLAQSNYLAESQNFAKLVQEELNTALGLRDRGVKQAPFKVLNGAAMPAVLVEFGFLSNPAEEEKLNDASHRDDLVEAMVRAVGRYRARFQPQEPEPTGDEVGR